MRLKRAVRSSMTPSLPGECRHGDLGIADEAVDLASPSGGMKTVSMGVIGSKIAAIA